MVQLHGEATPKTVPPHKRCFHQTRLYGPPVIEMGRICFSPAPHLNSRNIAVGGIVTAHRVGQGAAMENMRVLENIFTDRGSKYAVSGGPCASPDEARAFIKTLCRKKKFAKATHNTWAVLLPDGTPLKNDDGEAGAGMVILRMLERADRVGEIIVVTRWFGGVHLGGDRFRRVQDAVRVYLDDV